MTSSRWVSLCSLRAQIQLCVQTTTVNAAKQRKSIAGMSIICVYFTTHEITMQDTFFYYAVLGAKSYRVLPIPDPRMMGVMKILIGIFACAMLCAQTEPLPPAPTDVKPGSITYDEIPYPYPVSYLPLTLYGQDVRMAYMDVPPAGAPNGRVVVLFDGMNFGGFYFGGPIEALRKAGFRVVVHDQIGFGLLSNQSR